MHTDKQIDRAIKQTLNEMVLDEKHGNENFGKPQGYVSKSNRDDKKHFQGKKLHSPKHDYKRSDNKVNVADYLTEDDIQDIVNECIEKIKGRL